MTTQHRPLPLWAVPAVCDYCAESTGWLCCPPSCPVLLQTWFHACFHCCSSFPFWQNFLFSCNYGEGLREEGLSLKTTLSGEHCKQKAAEHSLRACSSSTSFPQDLRAFFSLFQHLLETGPVLGSGDNCSKV